MIDASGKVLLEMFFFNAEGSEFDSSQIRMKEYMNGKEVNNLTITGQNVILTDNQSGMTTTITANGGLTSVNDITKDSMVLTTDRVSLKIGNESFVGIDKTLLVQEVGAEYKTKLRFVHGILVEANIEL